MLAVLLMAIWPGFAMDEIPVAIYDGKRTTLHGHPSPPPEFPYEGRHPLVNANSSATIGGVETATIVSPNPTPGLIAHEKFHVHQRTKHPSWSANEADLFLYPEDDVEALSLQQREFEALRAALEGDACAVRLALALRRERFAKIGATAAAYERGTELNEGLATYVENVVTGFSPSRGGLKPAATFRERMYATGAALAVLLDRYDPAWKETLERGDRRSLDELLAAAVEPRTTAEEEARAVRERRVQRRREFLGAKGWTVVITGTFFPERFDPWNVQLLGNGEVLHTRFLRLNGDGGAIEIDGRAVLTEGSGAHPLFNGIRRITLTGFAKKPEVIDGKLVAEGVHAVLKGAKVEINP